MMSQNLLLEWQKLKLPIFLLFVLAFALFRCGTKENRNIVATVDNRPITIDEFKLRYDFTPHIEKSKQVDKRRYEFLASLVGEKLLARYAEENKWDQDRKVQAQIKQLEKEALVETLLNEIILKNVELRDSEIDSALNKKHTKLELDVWSFPSEAEAKAFAKALASNASSTKLYRPEQHSLVWGQGAPHVEDIAYSLKLGETSQPIPIEGQYLLIRLKSKTKLPSDSDEKVKLREQVTDILRARKESEAIDSFIHRIMHDNEMHISKQIFARTVDAIAAATIEEETPHINGADSLLRNLDERQVRLIRHQLGDLLSAPLVRFDDGMVWTVGETIEKLATSPFQLPKPSSPSFPNALRSTLRRIAELDYMAKEAEAQGLKNSQYFKTQASMWRDALLTQKALQEINTAISISEQDVKDFYRAHIEDFKTPPMVNLYQIIVSNRTLAEEIRKKIDSGQDFARIARQYASTGLLENDRIETGYITYGTLGPLAKRIREARIGDIVGPAPFQSKFVLLKVIDKKLASYQELTTVYKDVAHDARIEKLSNILDDLLTQMLKKSKIEMNKAVIDTLHLVPTGAVVVKSHFPGRMLAPISYPFNNSKNYYHLFRKNFVN